MLTPSSLGFPWETKQMETHVWVSYAKKIFKYGDIWDKRGAQLMDGIIN